MPHYKCASCRVRLEVPGNPAELVGDLCPECGSLMRPAVDLAELIGCRRIVLRDQPAESALAGTVRPIAAWLDDEADEGFNAAFALPPPRRSL